MIGLFVSDLPKMTAFYRDVMRMEIDWNGEGPYAEFERMRSLGAAVVYGPRDEPWKMRSAMVADPDGNLIEIASDFWE